MTKREVERFCRTLREATDQVDGGDARDARKALERLKAEQTRPAPWGEIAKWRVAECERVLGKECP